MPTNGPSFGPRTCATLMGSGLLWFLFGTIGNDDAPDALFLFLDALDENAIAKRPHIYEHSPLVFILGCLTWSHGPENMTPDIRVLTPTLNSYSHARLMPCRHSLP
jgi:hypothetical protein